MKGHKELYIIPIITSIASVAFLIAFITTFQVQAQVESQDRVFEKDFCASEDTLLDDIIYNTGDQISYDSSGCPISTKVIHRWDEISTSRQTVVTTRLATEGYEDVTESVSQVLRGNGQ